MWKDSFRNQLKSKKRGDFLLKRMAFKKDLAHAVELPGVSTNARLAHLIVLGEFIK